jgi:FlaA1/EpsC-like NDP-sugar epimerase
MLRRQQRLRQTTREITDILLFSAALWLAHAFRMATGDWDLWGRLGGSVAIQPFRDYVILYVPIVLFSPLLMEFVGFYKRPAIAARRDTAWRLFRACVLGTIGLILVLFLFRMNLARAVIILFGVFSFALVMVKELAVRAWLEGNLGGAKLRHRVLLLGTPEDTRRLRNEFRSRKVRDVEVAGELDINTTPATALTERLHELNPNGVILSATHTFFGQIEKAIEVCEREGVEVWLMADFCHART